MCLLKLMVLKTVDVNVVLMVMLSFVSRNLLRRN